MTDKQKEKVRNKAYKYYDEIVFENPNWSKRDIAILSFQAGAKYALANKHDELKEQSCDIVQFLKDNGAYEKFLDNLAGKRSKEEIIDFFRQDFGQNYCINCAFAWASTPEGHRFWSEINAKWMSLSK